MINKILYGVGSLLLFVNAICLGQSLKNIQPLDTGQKMPDIVLNNVINYSKDQIHLSDLKGKLVIIDFWGTGCTACVESFPHIEQLQKEFGNKLQIIMVNKESKDSTEHFFSLHPHIKLPQVPFATGDSILGRYFPHYLVPEHIWINEHGIIMAITDPQNATPVNIQKVLDGNHLVFRVKRDVYSFKSDLPVIAQNDEPFLNNIKYSSSLLTQIGIGGYSSLIQEGAKYPYHICCDMFSARLLFIYAFQENGKYDFEGAKNSVILDVKDKNKFEMPKDPNQYNYWATHYSYCYDLWVPPDQAYRIYDIMKNDLKNYFNAYGKIEKREVECLVLIRTTKRDLLHSMGGKSGYNFRKPPYDSSAYFSSMPFKDFVIYLQLLLDQQQLATPFVDATRYIEKVNIALPASLFDGKFDLDLLRKSLIKYGLDIRTKKQKINVLVIHELESDKKR